MEKKIYKLFIASPSDTAVERDICDKVIDELNTTLGDTFCFRIESIRWENNVRPVLKNVDGQSEINSQVGQEFEIFIGIMNKKFGTPTPRAGSGTEEEFNNAFTRFKDKGDVEVIFYFNDAPPNKLSEINPEEWGKVVEFKKVLAQYGIYGLYHGAQDFEDQLRKHLTKFFIERFKSSNESSKNVETIINKEALRKIFSARLNEALRGFDNQPKIWVEPVISVTDEISQNPDDNYRQRFLPIEIIHSTESFYIRAPNQFGLTTLGHYLIKEAWENNELWIYLDNKNTKAHTIQNAVKNEVNSLDQELDSVKCIIFDSFISNDKTTIKKLKTLTDTHPQCRFIVLHSISDSGFISDSEETENIELKVNFRILHLLALPRTQVREVVKQYNCERRIDEDDKVLNKVIADLESLNIHRTPYNCLTLLKVSEKYFDDSPVNRTKMIEMILFVLFDMGDIPRYKTKPDMKDCEFVLGFYCEKLIRSENYEFTRENFIVEIKNFCAEKYIDLDVEVVFDVLYDNNIIVYKYGIYTFRAAFWIFYFGAKQMNINEDFKDYIFDQKRYISFPEIIEFYSGIDRNRNDILEILEKDLKETRTTVFNKIGIQDNINPLEYAKWKPTEESIEKIQNEISENVLSSKLPDEVKDEYLDRRYDQIRPYNQTISKIFEEYSLHSLMQNIKASSCALRNSDYAKPELKKSLLKEIYHGWEQISKVLFALAPIMAKNGEAAFEGMAFYLAGDFGDTFEEKLNTIIQANPTNVVGYFKEDLYSPKLGPLLYENFRAEPNLLLKHQQALMIIFKRPNGWKKEIEDYIVSLHKNSFFLYDTVNALRAKYRYDFASTDELKQISYLAKMGIAKHAFGDKKPGLNQIVKIDNSNLKREIE